MLQLQYLAGHFDTNTAGAANEKDTFAKIAEEVDAKAEEILFVTSVVEGTLYFTLQHMYNTV